ncbi:MAG: DUF5060 domain-containing protein [Chitinivibrionales bacterium]|nr:DUF5060 domain-containing protein [Chitinivibrionales bacterium]
MYTPLFTRLTKAAFIFLSSWLCLSAFGATSVEIFAVHEMDFLNGLFFTTNDINVENVELYTEWEHEDGQTKVKVHGFWNGGESGQVIGSVFKVRFCPTKLGKWTLTKTVSNEAGLNNKQVGEIVNCIPRRFYSPVRHGFWIADGRYFTRSDGTRQYIIGTSQLRVAGEAHAVQSVRLAGEYFNKYRMYIADNFGNSNSYRPFYNNNGDLSAKGDYANSPNVKLFRKIDSLVLEAQSEDMIIDLVLESRDVGALTTGGFLRYVAARYGSYFNVWFSLCNECNSYSATQINDIITQFESYLAYPTPIGVMSPNGGSWSQNFGETVKDAPFTHAIYKSERGEFEEAFNQFADTYDHVENKPVFNDEAGYQKDSSDIRGKLNSLLAVIAAGGYGSVAQRENSNNGQMYTDAFDTTEFTLAPRAKWLRELIDSLGIWNLVEDTDSTRYEDAHNFAKLKTEDERTFMLLGSRQRTLTINLSADGQWEVTRYMVADMADSILVSDTADTFTFTIPEGQWPKIVTFVNKAPVSAMRRAGRQVHTVFAYVQHAGGLSLTSLPAGGTASLVNAVGRVVVQVNATAQQQAVIPTRKLPNGLYFLHVKSGARLLSKPVYIYQ